MKKYFAISFLILFIIPSFALASWWNPFSWNIFKKKSINQEQVIVDKIQPNNLDTNKEEIEKLKKEIDDLKKEKAGNDLKKETKSISNKIVTESKSEIKKDIVIIPQEKQNNIETSQITDDKKDNGTSFEVIRLRQSIFDNPNYGGYDITVKIVAGKDDIYIPMSTTDSTITLTGFSYSITGDPFRGRQSSKVDCSNYKNIGIANYCIIRHGESQTFSTVVYLTPEQSGNYGILFEDINFLRNENFANLESFKVNRTTQKIYIKK